MPDAAAGPTTPDPETVRLAEDARREKNWKRWGPYLAERQWATVREDYSPDGNCWEYFPHDHARSRAYRWGEDGLLGICDRECRLCFALALWNGRDPILKERLFGLTAAEGNHGEDVKEEYFYLDSTPTHSYMRALYKYPQAEFPYARLVDEARRRGRAEPEFELAHTGVFDAGRYFDVQAEYAKATPDDILIRITVTNRGPETATLTLLPTLWFRNAWSWGSPHESGWIKPRITAAGTGRLRAEHQTLGAFWFAVDRDAPGGDRPGKGPARGTNGPGEPTWLFTENETNFLRLFGAAKGVDHAKDAFHEYVVGDRRAAVNPTPTGSKAASLHRFDLKPGESRVVRCRLWAEPEGVDHPFGRDFEGTFARRAAEADRFCAAHLPARLRDSDRRIARQAWAGLFWSKQFYHYVVGYWLNGDPNHPAPAPQRRRGRNADWNHLYARDVISMPDKWEYPWFAAWDLAFHIIAIARLDPHFAKSQLLLLLREWYMHPSGQIPAYEFAFGDVNPPVHAWACWRVYKMTGARGKRDRLFLARAFQKLLLNFTWWVNRKDPDGKHIFAGGFLGLDNIGVFDRSSPLPAGVRLEQADATAWMAFYCGTMLSMALELAREDPAYEDIASKFFEHFVAITDAMNTLGGSGLWDDEDGFYYDQIDVRGRALKFRIRSMVGIIPLFAVEVLDQALIERLPGFHKRMRWFLENRKDLARHIAYMASDHAGGVEHRLLAIPSRDRLARTLRYVLDEREFLSPFGVRSLSRAHEERPYVFRADHQEFVVRYTPGESDSSMFGGNSNWRGPVWFPVNFLLIEALERYHHFYGPTLLVEHPTGSGNTLTLAEVADDLRARLCSLFIPDADGRRPCHADDARYARDPHYRDLVLFHEYFHPETGQGLGASHQTGWTALVANLLCDH